MLHAIKYRTYTSRNIQILEHLLPHYGSHIQGRPHWANLTSYAEHFERVHRRSLPIYISFNLGYVYKRVIVQRTTSIIFLKDVIHLSNLVLVASYESSTISKRLFTGSNTIDTALGLFPFGVEEKAIYIYIFFSLTRDRDKPIKDRQFSETLSYLNRCSRKAKSITLS